MSDSSEIDAALVAALAGDGTLSALTTDGVWMDMAPNGKTKFVIVSLIIHEDMNSFDGRALERATYLVKAVEQNVSGAITKAAALRIDEVLQDQPLTITGYTHLVTRRVERVRYTEVDDVNADIRWQHRGGRYEIVVSPDETGSPGSP